MYMYNCCSLEDLNPFVLASWPQASAAQNSLMNILWDLFEFQRRGKNKKARIERSNRKQNRKVNKRRGFSTFFCSVALYCCCCCCCFLCVLALVQVFVFLQLVWQQNVASECESHPPVRFNAIWRHNGANALIAATRIPFEAPRN